MDVLEFVLGVLTLLASIFVPIIESRLKRNDIGSSRRRYK